MMRWTKMLDRNDIISALEYLISDGCTDTQYDSAPKKLQKKLVKALKPLPKDDRKG